MRFFGEYNGSQDNEEDEQSSTHSVEGYEMERKSRLYPMPSEESVPSYNNPSENIEYSPSEIVENHQITLSSRGLIPNNDYSSRTLQLRETNDIELRDTSPEISPKPTFAYHPSNFNHSLPCIPDYDDEDVEYESLVFFDLPRPLEGGIVIAVQAASIGSLKMNEEQENKIDNVELDLDSGMALVGVVREVGLGVHSVKVGDRVATIVRSMMRNVRYARVDAVKAVIVPCGLDPAEAAACAYTYTLGFQSLTHGLSHLQGRYSRNIFQNKSILVTNGASTCGLATIQLARSLGAERVYAIGQVDRLDLLKSFGAEALTESQLPQFEGKMDLVIDSTLAKKFHHRVAQKALKKDAKGKVVYVGSPISIDGLKSGSKDSWVTLLQGVIAQIALIFLDAKATYYDLFSHYNNYPERTKDDLYHVLILLAEGRIRPQISKYVSLDELTYGLVTVDPGAIAGSIICEPWKKRGPPREGAKEDYTHWSCC
uniref:Enoyl reductase (ER) domain-containing protein n=1 Tax=Chaetoceros debilis TaxID=122233 RepID=A0A7S3QD36_9STRA|mmetsp:Transcript_10237/g.15456  ORF Transcript_10237/g.15456 Transcript_10237/m.15456 type:complete len:484 (-) Transcript_10237:2474-3925(-)